MGRHPEVRVSALVTISLLLLYSLLASVAIRNPSQGAIIDERKISPESTTERFPVVPGFHMNDSMQVAALTGVLAAVPPLFGHSERDGYKLFPPYEYPRCADKNPPVPRTYVNLDYTRNRFSMRCLGTFPGKFVLGPIYNVTFTNQYELFDRWKLRDYTGPVKIPSSTEFVIATCRPKTSHFELLKTLPRFRRDIKFRAIRTAQKLQSASRKPLVIAMLTLDSFSRNHFYRKLHRTVNYLEELQQGKVWHVTDFKLHNIIGTDTVENQARIFGSYMREFRETGYRNPDKLGDDAIWAKLRKLGFVSMLGFEACAFKMKAYLGRKPNVDHVVNPFYCASSRFSSYTSSKYSGPVQRCLGPNMSHICQSWSVVYLMNYTLNFVRMYGGANQWLYNHFTAAHENTGQHASTIDRDLKDYLESLIGQFGNKTDLVIFLMGDHGMRYGNYKSSTEAVQEHRLPAFFLLARREYLDRIPHSYETLKHNSLRLTTKPDIRRTILAMANRQSGKRVEEEKKRFVDIFTEKVPNGRTCDHVEIPLWYCSANPLRSIPSYIYNDTEERYKERTFEERNYEAMLLTLAQETIVTIGTYVHSPQTMSLGQTCRKMTFRNIQQANTAFSEAEQRHLFKMTLGVNENADVRLDSYLVVSRNADAKVPLTEQAEYPSFPLLFLGEKFYGKVIMVYRLDHYGGTCERVAREADLEAEHCLCTHEALLAAKSRKSQKD